jgi:hypothetical protein
MSSAEPTAGLTDETEMMTAAEGRSLLAGLLHRSSLYRTGADFLELLNFVSRMRHFAPFNAMLLQIQKRGLRFAASEHDWLTRYSRTVKDIAARSRKGRDR